MGFDLSDEEIKSYLMNLDENFNANEIDFELFARLIAILLEEYNSLNQNSLIDDKSIEDYWFIIL